MKVQTVKTIYLDSHDNVSSDTQKFVADGHTADDAALEILTQALHFRVEGESVYVPAHRILKVLVSDSFEE